MARKLPRSGLLAAPLAGVALVLSLGARTLPAPDGSWLGVLPASAFIVGVLVASVAAALAWGVATRRWPFLAAWPAAAWSGVVIAVLPWLPLPLPAACFVWLGPLAWLAWAGAVATGVACLTADRPAWPSVLARWTADRRRGGWLAGMLALVLFAAAYASVRSILPGGDEPHYLVIAESLRRDGDLAIDDNHERGDYLPFFRGELAPDYLRRGVDRRIYSIHAPGLPVLVLPAYAAFGYAGVIAALLIASAWGAALLWRLVRDVTADAGAAWFAWAAAVLASPILFHAFTVFPDGVAGVAALDRRPRPGGDRRGAARPRSVDARVLADAREQRRGAGGAALAAHARRGDCRRARPGDRRDGDLAAHAVAAGGGVRDRPGAECGRVVRLLPARLRHARSLGAVRRLHADRVGARAGRRRRAAAGRPVRRARRRAGVRAGAVRPRLDGDRRPGRRPRAGRLDGRAAASSRVAIVAAFVGYTIASASYRMWWGGASAPARFLVPMLLPMALPIGVAWSRTRGLAFGGVAARALAIAALLVTAAVTLILVGVDDGRLAYGSRTAVAGWTRWASPAVDLARALPGVHRSTPGRGGGPRRRVGGRGSAGVAGDRRDRARHIRGAGAGARRPDHRRSPAPPPSASPGGSTAAPPIRVCPAARRTPRWRRGSSTRARR